MKFVPKRLEQTANVSRGKTRLGVVARTLVVLVGASLLLILLLATVFDQIAANLSDESEQHYLGWMTDTIPMIDVTADGVSAQKYEWAQTVLNRVIEVGCDRSLPYELKMIEFDEPNAFAAPGGTIAISPALFDWVETEEGLAFVLAHELAHHEARHVGRRMARVLFVVLVQTVLEDSAGPFPVDWMGELAVAQYSQSQEYEADLMAIKRLKGLYPDLSNATEFLERALEAEGDFPVAMGIWQTHPPTIERLERLKKQINGTFAN